MEPALQVALEKNPFIQFMYVTNMEGRKITRNITHIVDRAKLRDEAWTRTCPTAPGSSSP